MNNYFKRTPPHFIVPPPHHFRIREDLLDEFCLTEAYQQFLPRNDKAHARWLRCLGRTADELPLAHVIPFAGKPYRLTPRYLLAAEIVPGTRYRTNLAIDRNGLPQILPHQGLFPFVVERAIHFCVRKGMPESQARLRFLPPLPQSAPLKRIESEWALGFDLPTGFCTILFRGTVTETCFLSARNGWLTPFPREE